jgi:hypothetical protein
MSFSPRYKSYEEWLEHFRGSEAYKQRIIRLHSKYPNASLSQLRGHPKVREKPLHFRKKEPIYRRSWTSITDKQAKHRKKALEVLREVRNGRSLSKASKELHIKPETVIKHTNAFKKVKGRWIAKSQDRISRIMSIYVNGQEEWIEVRDSRIASKIGKYNSAVKEFLISGNEAVLEPFKKPFKDGNGKLHYFETDPNKLYEIAVSREEPEFYEIYKI